MPAIELCRRLELFSGYLLFSLLLGPAALVNSQQGAFSGSSSTAEAPNTVRISVVDETGQSIAGAKVSVREPGLSPVELWTDYAGHCVIASHQGGAMEVVTSKPGYYQNTQSDVDIVSGALRIALTHEQIVREQVDVTDSSPGIDVEQTADQVTMNTPEIVNIPYPTSRDIRNILPFNPGIVADGSGQVHVAGSETWQTLDEMDGFDVRSPVHGSLSMRVSPDAVRTLDAESTRYPVEFGRATGGVISFYTRMGDNKFREGVLNFV